MMKNNIAELTREFHKFETNVIKPEDWEIWDAIRFHVYYSLQDTILGVPGETYISKSKRRKYLRLLFEAGKFLHACIRARGKNLIFAASRFKDEFGKNYDPNIIDIYSIIENDCLILDSINLEGESRYPRVFNRWVFLAEKINGIFHKYFLPAYIPNELYNTFGIKVSDELINRALNRYYAQKFYYKYLFKLIKPNKIFIVQNGIQKGLFKVAKNLDIPVVELQHGIIYYSHLAYSYPSNINNKLLSNPKFFFVYSEFWRNKVAKYFPIEKIIVSGNTKASEIKIHPIKYSLTFITTSAYTPRFIEIIKQLRAAGYNKSICLKLHPQQRNEVESIKRELDQYLNVEVIYIELSMKDVIGMSESLLTIQSTSAYEVLDAGKRLYILKELSYENHSDIFDNPLVELIENTGQLLASLNQSVSVSSIPHFRYFEPFHKERVEEILN